MKFGLPLSFGIHVFSVLGSLVLWRGNVDLEQFVIVPVELVSVADITDIKATRKKPPKEIIPDLGLAIPEIAEEKPSAPAALDATEETKELAEESPKPDPKQSAFSLNDFAVLAKDARDSDTSAGEQRILVSEANIAQTDQQGIGAQSGNTVKPQEYIAGKLAGLWQINDGAANYSDLLVVVRLYLDEKGDIVRLDILNEAQIIASNNPAWKTALENAESALRTAAPYNGLRSLDYEKWKMIKINMKPEE
ncbi:MAG: hypothetical protein V3U57_04590 [Robiginitomaculum sp.]